MSVSTVCNHNVATIDSDEDIVEAAVRMREAHVGDLIVVERRDGRAVPIGIITDRDIVVGIVAKKTQPALVKVGDAMSAELLTVHQDNGIEFALREMRRVGVRRVPVLGDNRELVGVLSIDDVIDHLAVQLGHIADIIRLEQQAETSTRP
ncbi:MAG TPA: CBS domain-containing protein [Gammaproteobacteria bacterium]|nr:CBS domain-containing protein [Gammaproteobacteria bacterium]